MKTIECGFPSIGTTDLSRDQYDLELEIIIHQVRSAQDLHRFDHFEARLRDLLQRAERTLEYVGSSEEELRGLKATLQVRDLAECLYTALAQMKARNTVEALVSFKELLRRQEEYGFFLQCVEMTAQEITFLSYLQEYCQ